MTTINLYQSSGGQDSGRGRSQSLFDGTFVLSIGILLAVIAGSFAIKIYGQKLGKENELLQSEISAAEARGLSGAVVAGVVDFQTRLDLIKERQVKNVRMNEVLDKISSSLLSGVMIDTYSYDSKKGNIELKMLTNDYRTMASQLLSFKSSEGAAGGGSKNFSNVEISSIRRVEKGVEFAVSMNLGR